MMDIFGAKSLNSNRSRSVNRFASRAAVTSQTDHTQHPREILFMIGTIFIFLITIQAGNITHVQLNPSQMSTPSRNATTPPSSRRKSIHQLRIQKKKKNPSPSPPSQSPNYNVSPIPGTVITNSYRTSLASNGPGLDSAVERPHFPQQNLPPNNVRDGDCILFGLDQVGEKQRSSY